MFRSPSKIIDKSAVFYSLIIVLEYRKVNIRLQKEANKVQQNIALEYMQSDEEIMVLRKINSFCSGIIVLTKSCGSDRIQSMGGWRYESKTAACSFAWTETGL